MVNNEGYFSRNSFSPLSFPPAAVRMSAVKLELPNLPASWEIVSGPGLFMSTSRKYSIALCPGSSDILKGSDGGAALDIVTALDYRAISSE